MIACAHDCANCESARECKSEIFERRGEWSGYAVQKSEKGFLVKTWSRVQGEITDRVELIPYGTKAAWGYGPQTSLFAAHNSHHMVGQALAEYAVGHEDVRVLRKGHIVR